MLKITDYADRLLDDLDGLDWPTGVKELQRNWIGKSHGAEIDFSIKNSPQSITVFSTRPDTLYGATFMVLAPEHPLVSALVAPDKKKAVASYQEEVERKSDLERTGTAGEKTGVFLGSYAINPASGEEVPIWISDFVLPSYGTGAVMAVPAHDQRDWEFAKTFSLPIKSVIEGPSVGVGGLHWRRSPCPFPSDRWPSQRRGGSKDDGLP